MKLSGKVILGVIVVALLGLVLAGCGESTTTTAAPTATTAAPTETTAAPSGEAIKVGFSGPLTGNAASVGQDYLNGVNLYFDKVNAEGGINGQKIEVLAEDDQADPKNSTIVAQKLVDAGVVAVLGPLTSGSTIPTMSIYADANIAQITPATNPDVTSQGVKGIFRVDPDDYAQGGNTGTFVAEKWGVKSIAIIHDKQAFGQGVAEQFQKGFEEAGGTVTSVNSITPGDVDFQAVLTKVKSENPELVYYGGVAAEGGLIVAQMRELGMEQKFMGPDQLFGPEFIKIAGTGGEGAYITYVSPPADTTPALKAFFEEFKAEFGAEPFVGQYGYDSAVLVAEGIKAAGKVDGAALIDALHSNTITGVLGDYTFDETGALAGGGPKIGGSMGGRVFGWGERVSIGRDELGAPRNRRDSRLPGNRPTHSSVQFAESG